MMELGKESLYGWGVCQLPMPRARKDIYADRRRGQQSVDFPDRRTSKLLRPFTAVLAASLRDDFPAAHTVIVALSAALLLLIFGLPIRSLSPEVVPPAPEPVEIVTRLLQEPLTEPLLPVEPVVTKAPPEPKRQTQPVAVKPPVKKAPPQPKKIASLPQSKTETLLRPAENKQVQPVERRAVMPKKTVSLANPRQQAPLLSTPAPKPSAQNFTVPTAQQPRLVTASPALGNRSAEPLVAARKTAPVTDYRLKPGTSGQPALAQGKQFAPTARGTTVDLPTASGPSSDFSIPRSQGGHAIATAGRSFAPEPGQAKVEIAAAGQVAGSYAASSSQGAGPLTSGEVESFAGPAASAGIDLPVSPRSGVAANVSSSTGTVAGNGPPDSAVNFVGEGEASVDPNLFISLNQLDACVDQSEEDRLRTELAIRLDSNIVYPCGQMKFDIRNVETGQTVWMRIYNPRDFSDRCAALLSAIECINHSK